MPFAERRTFLGLSVPAWIGAVLTLGGVAWLVWFLIGLGPKKVEGLAVPAELSGAQWRVSREIDEIEQAYRDAGEMIPADMEARLQHAVQLQEQLIKGGAEAGQAQALRLDRLLVARDTVRARGAWDRITALEDTLAATTEDAARVILLEELLARRREINRSRATARYKDLVRETQLEREYESLRAGPLRLQADEEQRLAQQAVDAGQWAEALAHYTRAREIMDEVNQNFGRTRFADIALRTRLHAEETSLQGAVEAAEVDVYLKGADEAAVDRPELAVEYYQRAAELQDQLNQRWPKSRFYSTSLLRTIQEKMQTVQAEGLVARVQAADAGATQALAARQIISARARISAVLALVQSPLVASANGPKAGGVDWERKYRFLDGLGETLRDVQDETYAQMVPLPGRPEVLLMRGEVTQGFYVKLMKFNPSRESGDDRAVDSVTWLEAMEFCERLGWVLGRKVRLPTADEFDAAARNAADYEALFDGVAEWLQVTTEDTAALVWPADGSAWVSGRAKDTRARDLGFRVVIETTAEEK